MVQEGSE